MILSLSIAINAGWTAEADTGFYASPGLSSTTPGGVLIRTEPGGLAFTAAGERGVQPGTATKLMYSSIDRKGGAVAVTGTYIEPSAAWNGAGSRPLVVLAPDTHGLGDQCAPSRQVTQPIAYEPPFDVMFEYEIPALYSMLSSGLAVVMTDYQGLGTDGVPNMFDRVEQGHAVLDAARAALALPAATVDSRSPVGFYGYAQGGGATAAAAELATEYAPELTVAGSYSGAPPMNAAHVLTKLDGSSLSGFIGYVLAGIRESDPVLGSKINALLNGAGRDMLDKIAHQCLVETALTFGFRNSSEFTMSGMPLPDSVLSDPDIRRYIDGNRIGAGTPAMPVLVDHARSDEVYPYEDTVDTVNRWCSNGARVTLQTDELPALLGGSGLNHAAPLVHTISGAVQWLQDRFRGLPSKGTC